MSSDQTASRNAAKKKGRNRLGNLVSRFFGTKTKKSRKTDGTNNQPKTAGSLAQRKRFLDSL